MSNAILASLRNNAPRKDDQNILTFQHEGYLIFVGRNSFSNERLVGSHEHRDCLWLHALAARGSHVVLCVNGRQDPSVSVIEYAASIALKHSHSNARTVSVALLRDVFKPEESGTGVWKTHKYESVEVPVDVQVV